MFLGTIAARGTNTGKPELSDASATKDIEVLASPNPYSSTIRFVLKSKVSGQATLDMYNTLGQKMANVFRGHVNAGRTQTINYTVPASMRTNMIYKFEIAGRVVSGKLLKQ